MTNADREHGSGPSSWLQSLRSQAAPSNRPVVCIQGLGFVGAAMAVAVARAEDRDGHPWFDVIGVDLPSPQGRKRIAAINEGRFPFPTVDQRLVAELARVHRRGNLRATDAPDPYGRAAVTVVDLPLDVVHENGRPGVRLEGLRDAIRALGTRMPAGSLVVVETTVPPGTCQKVIAPILAEESKRRGMPADAILLAHSYERVMPGAHYLDSITSFWRVYSGHTPEATEACERFLSKVIDVERFPLARLRSTTASEIGKVLENSYRATNIAFIEEWGRFAEAVGVDLFEVLEAIRVRPTHSNIRQPGFGVGGYCLTKDPLLAAIAAREYYGLADLDFPFSTRAVAVNNAMPLVTVAKVESLLGGSLAGRTLGLFGISYRQDVGDSRYSPSEVFAREVVRRGARLVCHDPLLDFWPEMDVEVPRALPPADALDAAVFAVPHSDYASLDFAAWLGRCRPLVFDANNVLTERQREALRSLGCRLASIGRGEAA